MTILTASMSAPMDPGAAGGDSASPTPDGQGSGLASDGGVCTLVDTHCHLDARQFEGEPTEAVLDRARLSGVTRVVTIGTDVETSRRATALAGSHHGLWASVGIDPNDLDGFGEASLSAIDELAALPGVVAIGEIGLDYYWDRAPRDAQMAAFEAQLELARRHGLPVVIHSRDAMEDTVRTLESWSAGAGMASPSGAASGLAHGAAAGHAGSDDDGSAHGVAAGSASVAPIGAMVERPLGVMHCYSGDRETAERLIEAGFIISLAGNVTFPKAVMLHDVATHVPEHALVLETDAPYLSPQPYRGRRNEPARVKVIAEFVAALRSTTLEAIADSTSANAERLFGWEGAPS